MEASKTLFYEDISRPLSLLNQFISDLRDCRKNPFCVFGGFLTIREANELLGFILVGYCREKPVYYRSIPGGILNRKGKLGIPKHFKGCGYKAFDGAPVEDWRDIVDHLIDFEKNHVGYWMHYQGYRKNRKASDLFEAYNNTLTLLKDHLKDFFSAVKLSIDQYDLLRDFCGADFADSLKIRETEYTPLLPPDEADGTWINWAVELRAKCLKMESVPVARKAVWTLERIICEYAACAEIGKLISDYPEFCSVNGIYPPDAAKEYASEDYIQILGKAAGDPVIPPDARIPDIDSILERKNQIQLICTSANAKVHFDIGYTDAGSFFNSDRKRMEYLLDSLETVNSSSRFSLKPTPMPIRKIGFNGFVDLIVEDTGCKMFLAPPADFQSRHIDFRSEDQMDPEYLSCLLETTGAAAGDLERARRETAQQFSERKNGHYYNSDIAGVVGADPFFRSGKTEKPCLYYRVYQTDYFTHRVIERLIIEKLSREKRLELAAELLPFHFPPSMRTSLGVNLLLEMKKRDGSVWVFLTRRSGYSSYGEGNKIYLSVTETLAWETLAHEGPQNPIERTVELGLEQELGIDSSLYSISDLHILGSFFECSYCQDNVFAVLKIEESEQFNEKVLNQSIGRSQDGFLEIGSSLWVSRRELVRFMNDHRDEFRDQAYFCLEWYLEEASEERP